MTGLDEQYRTLVAREGGMATCIRITHPGTGGVIAVLVANTAFNNKGFLAAFMRVLPEWRVRRPVNQAHTLIFKVMQ